jgi:hypothetical protein
MLAGKLYVTHPDGYRQAVPLGGGPVRIGSAPDNDVVIDGPGVAPYHATFRFDDEGDLLVRCSGAYTGTAGAEIEIELPRSFAPAMLLRIGGCVLSYKPDTQRSTRPIEAAAIDEPRERAAGDESDFLYALLQQPGVAWARAGEADDPHDAVTMEMPVLPVEIVGD